MNPKNLPTPRHLLLFRNHFGLSQEASAKHLGVTRVTWSRWETGKSDLPPYLLFALRGLATYLKEELNQD